MFREESLEPVSRRAQFVEEVLHVGGSDLQRTAVVAERFGFPSADALRKWAKRHGVVALGHGRWYDVRDVQDAIRGHRRSSFAPNVGRRRRER